MKSKNLFLLAALAAVIGVVAIWSAKGRDVTVASDEVGESLIPGLVERVNQIAKLEVSKGAEKVTLVKEGESWRVEELGGYPARFQNVKETIVKIANLEIEAAMTKDPGRWEKLGVEDPDENATNATLVTMWDDAGNEAAAVIVGRPLYDSGAGSIYVRKMGDPQSWRCSGLLTPGVQRNNWVDRDIVKIDNGRIATVSIDHAEGADLTLARSGDNPSNFDVANMPPGRELKYAGAPNPVATALAALTLEDVRPLSDVDFSAPRTVSTFKTVDGLVLTIRVVEHEGAAFANLSAEFVEPAVPPSEVTDPADPLASDELPTAEVQAEVVELNGRLSPWAFELPAYKAGHLETTLESLLAEVAPPDPADVIGPIAPLEDDSQPAPLLPETGPAPDAPVDDDPSDAGDDGAPDAGDGDGR